jgi:hypothetical protein
MTALEVDQMVEELGWWKSKVWTIERTLHGFACSYVLAWNWY